MNLRSQPQMLIAGAGIGGLTAALALHSQGISATVIDKAQTLKELGVGINLLPHAVRELHRLGLGDALRGIAAEPTVIAFFNRDGDELFREPRGISGGYGWPQLSVHRGRLQKLLLAEVVRRLGAGAVRTGTAVTGVDQDRSGVTVSTTAGELRADVLVGADGIHSVVRRCLHPGPDPLMWSGIRMWRGAAPMDPILDGHTMAIVHGHDDVTLVAYPIGGGLMNWIVQVPESNPGPLLGSAGWNTRATADEVRRHLDGWNLPWLDVDILVDHTDGIFGYPMVDRDPLPHWGTGRVTLLGDAAHPMYPVGANGGSQAVGDAAVLANELAHNGLRGLQTYENQRRPDTADVVAANRRMHATPGRTGEEIRRVTTDYRNNTARSTRS